MVSVLLWIVGCYVLTALVVYICSTLRLGRERRVKHYVLIAGNEGPRMEWYMRSLRRFSHLTGTDVKVTVVDNGSEDDTLNIARVFAKQGMNVQVHSAGGKGATVERTEESEQENGLRGQREGVPSAREIESRELSSAEAAAELNADAGRFGKWQRFRAAWRWRAGNRKDSEATSSASGKNGKPFEPTHLLWMLQAEGIVSAKDHAVLVDLRDPADLSKLPF